MVKLAVKKEEGRIPGGGFHYMLMPMRIEDAFQASAFERMGNIIIEVTDERAEELIKQAGEAMMHQLNVAVLADAAEIKRKNYK